jgi:hypothetical protein
MDPKQCRTSDVMRNAASWLAVVAMEQGRPRQTRAELEALAGELRLRARWMEAARSDTGVSVERMLGIQMLEDPE